jgi:hypothetical protein
MKCDCGGTMRPVRHNLATSGEPETIIWRCRRCDTEMTATVVWWSMSPQTVVRPVTDTTTMDVR